MKMEELKSAFERETEVTGETCEKHGTRTFRLKRTGEVVCLVCEREKKERESELKALELYRQAEEKKRQYYLNGIVSRHGELVNCSFYNFHAETKEQKADRDRLISEMKKYITEDPHNLVLIGDCGIGKSHLAYSLIRALSEKQKALVTFVNVIDVLGFLNSRLDEVDELVRRLKSFDYLLLDDLGTEKTTEWSTGVIYRILDERENTIITTNLSQKDILARYGKRLYSRIFKGCGDAYVYTFENERDIRIL